MEIVDKIGNIEPPNLRLSKGFGKTKEGLKYMGSAVDRGPVKAILNHEVFGQKIRKVLPETAVGVILGRSARAAWALGGVHGGIAVGALAGATIGGGRAGIKEFNTQIRPKIDEKRSSKSHDENDRRNALRTVLNTQVAAGDGLDQVLNKARNQLNAVVGALPGTLSLEEKTRREAQLRKISKIDKAYIAANIQIDPAAPPPDKEADAQRAAKAILIGEGETESEAENKAKFIGIAISISSELPATTPEQYAEIERQVRKELRKNGASKKEIQEVTSTFISTESEEELKKRMRLTIRERSRIAFEEVAWSNVGKAALRGAVKGAIFGAIGGFIGDMSHEGTRAEIYNKTRAFDSWIDHSVPGLHDVRMTTLNAPGDAISFAKDHVPTANPSIGGHDIKWYWKDHFGGGHPHPQASSKTQDVDPHDNLFSHREAPPPIHTVAQTATSKTGEAQYIFPAKPIITVDTPPRIPTNYHPLELHPIHIPPISHGETFGHILEQHGYANVFSDPKVLGTHAWLNFNYLQDFHKQMTDSKYLPQDHYFPATREEMWQLASQAINKEPGAMQKLIETMHWIGQGTDKLQVIPPSELNEFVKSQSTK